MNGWAGIMNELRNLSREKEPILIDCYHGVFIDEIIHQVTESFPTAFILDTRTCMKSEKLIQEMIYPDVTDDRIFGRMTELDLSDFFCPDRVDSARTLIGNCASECFIIGPGATLISDNWGTLVYADMPRWEIQQRQRAHLIDNLGVFNKDEEDWMLLYKQGYFVDWRVLDRYKKTVFDSIDFLLDTTRHDEPKMVSYAAILDAYDIAVSQPFSVVPFFDPGPWGGQWMKTNFDLPDNGSNYAWCFNCVPEENSLLIKIDEELIEIPAINLVFRHPKKLLGDEIVERFGDEFPIRFDYLDTIQGGNLSLQVHPTKEYIKQQFNMDYTQDESYYILEAEEDAVVYLGFKEDADVQECIVSLKKAQEGRESFDADRFVEKWPAKKHDHFLIPAGTIHCSGTGCMVLEISATPYIFTFKLWDWSRLGLDGKPRPINITHGEKVLDGSRKTQWVREQLVTQISEISSGAGWTEESTGLHSSQFIETRRYWFSEPILHCTEGTLQVIAVVEGDQVIIESLNGEYQPFTANYGEVVIIPASMDQFITRPSHPSTTRHGILKAYVKES